MNKKIGIVFAIVFVICISVIGIKVHDKSYAGVPQLYMELPKKIEKGNEFKVKVILNSDVDLYGVNAYIAYNPEIMEFVPDSEFVTGTAGMLELKDSYECETRNTTYEITFKALEIGETEVSLSEAYLVDYANLEQIEVTPSVQRFNIELNKNIAIDARLSELIVAPGEFTEAFDTNKFDYEMHVGLDVEEIGISAVPKEKDSVVGLDMPSKLELGENTVVVTVTALSGNTNTYTIKVYREEIVNQPEEETTTEEMTEVTTEVTTEASTSEEGTDSSETSSAESSEETVTTEDTTEIGTEETTEVVTTEETTDTSEQSSEEVIEETTEEVVVE